MSNMTSYFKHINIKTSIVYSLLLVSSIFAIPQVVFGGGGGYSQGYYQGYYQSYYQGVYATTFSASTTVSQNAHITGSLSKGSGTFAIDYPLDPANKILFHSFVESPDAKNIYDGVATLDSNGEASIKLPVYFEALNKDFRYQAKPITSPMSHLYIKTEVYKNSFTIAGGAPGGRISWQVTGIRHDPYILANPIIPVVEKGPNQIVKKGEYLFAGYEKTKGVQKAAQPTKTTSDETSAQPKESLSFFQKLFSLFKIKQ